MTFTTPSSKKVLYVITKSNFGGAQRYVYDLATHIPEDTCGVAVACGGTGLLVERLREAGIRTLEVQNFTRDVSLFRDVKTFFELTSLFRREQPDVVHLNSAKAVTIGALAARIARVPRIVSTIHGWASHEPRPWWQRIFIRAVEKIGVLLAHQTIVVCNHDRRAGTTVIHNGIETPHFLSREEARRILGLSPDTFVVGTVAELNKNKNISVLLDAFAQTQIPKATLAIIGDGEERASLSTRAKLHPECDIRFLGFKVEAMGGVCLRAFDVFVLPSQKEGLPYALLEAGTAALPVVATRVGGIPEIIEADVSGTLVPTHDANAIAHALQRYADDDTLRTTHGRALHAHIHTSFSLSHMLEKTAGLY